MSVAGERNTNIHEQEVDCVRLLFQNICSLTTCRGEFTSMLLDFWLIYMIVLVNGSLGQI